MDVKQLAELLQRWIEAEREEPDATLYDHLGDIYAALSQTDEARDAWQKSLTVESDDQVRKKLKALPR